MWVCCAQIKICLKIHQQFYRFMVVYDAELDPFSRKTKNKTTETTVNVRTTTK